MDASLYKRPNKPKTITVKRRERKIALYSPFAPPELLSVDKSTECHVTPAPVAAQMVSFLDVDCSHSVLEPEFGTGNLIAAVLDSCTPNIIGVERNLTLFNSTSARFPMMNLFNGCFLEYARLTDAKFDRIIMNPPFRNVRRHIESALGLLEHGGILVALVPINYNHTMAKDLATLERGVFATANVHTKIVRIDPA